MTEMHLAPKASKPARFGDILRVSVAALGGAAAAVLGYVAGRRRRPGWNVRFAALIAATRGVWSVMPKIGVVRWRNVAETLSPLKTDGLTPRFIREDRDGRIVAGAWLEPAGTDGPVLLYFHGGGFVFGSIRTHGMLIGALARAARARAFALDYRLGPEHPAPAAQEDAIAAYHYLLSEGIPPGQIVLVGDSAGGTMVLNTMIALRDAGTALPAAGVAISPWVDLACSGASFDTNSSFDYVGKVNCLLAAENYLAGIDPRRPDISPLFADLAGLPPLLMHAGDAEVLVDQIRAFAARAEAGGVEVQLAIYAGMVHVWHLFRDVTPEAQRAIDEIGAFVRKRAGIIPA
jgi:epsilon-lactone hydrolase